MLNSSLEKVLADLQKNGWDEQTALIRAEFERLEAEGVTAANHIANLKSDHARAIAAERTKERERIRGIMTHPEATNRKKQAESLAMETDMSVDVAEIVLKNSPVDQSARIPSIADRSADLAEFGSDFGGPAAGMNGANSGTWAKTLDNLNKGR